MDEVFADLFVLYDDIEQLAASSNFECGRFGIVLLFKADELRSDALHLSRVKVRRRLFIFEVEASNALLEAVACLERC